MKHLIASLIALFIFSVGYTPEEEDNVKYMQTVEYEGCEYVLYGGAAGGICHKGNCKNPAHND